MKSSFPASALQLQHRPGEVIAGRYVLKRKLGEGSMGVVWAAHSTPLDVEVALKVLRSELVSTIAVERMACEARTAAQLGHAALVRMLDFGTSERGEPFLAMELLEGEDLNARLARDHQIVAEEAVGLLLPIIDGLATAHEKGIVHRDIKPENIFIAVDERRRVQPKVLDFGIALQANPAAKLTEGGAIVGSPYYLSPEQAEGLEDVDARSDIWSVGVVLYECITGAPPFTGNNYNALLQDIVKKEPVAFTASGGNEQLWSVVERCLKKDREQRWASMWELGEALALWLFERGVRVDASARSLRHGWLESGLTGVQILIASDPPEPPTQPARVEPAPPPPNRLARLLNRPVPSPPRPAPPPPEPAPTPISVAASVRLAVVPMSKAFVQPARRADEPAPSSGGGWSWVVALTVAVAAATAVFVFDYRPWEERGDRIKVQASQAAEATTTGLAPLGLGALTEPVATSVPSSATPSASNVASAASAGKTSPRPHTAPHKAPSYRPARPPK
jgi:serine/threonine protein kinase